MVLYICELFTSNALVVKNMQIERIKKHKMTRKFKLKALVSYEIILAEMSNFFIEAIALCVS